MEEGCCRRYCQVEGFYGPLMNFTLLVLLKFWDYVVLQKGLDPSPPIVYLGCCFLQICNYLTTSLLIPCYLLI